MEHQAKLARMRGEAPDAGQWGQQHAGAGEDTARAKPVQRLKPHERVSAKPQEAQEIMLPDDVTVRGLASLLGAPLRLLVTLLFSVSHVMIQAPALHAEVQECLKCA